MYRISSISSAPKQTQIVILPNGHEMTLYVEYKPMQLGWFMTFTYEDFTATNIRIVNSPNILHQFKNLIPFGISCEVEEAQEPLLKEDFLSGRAKLYVLDTDEVEAFEDYLSGQETA